MDHTNDGDRLKRPDRSRMLGPYRVLRGNRNLRLLFAGQVVSALGDWLYITALIVLAYELTHSATVVAALTFVRLLPYAIFLPLGGVLADRFDRRTLMIVADLGRAACMFGLLAVTSRERVWVAFPLVFLATCLFSVFRPALGATVPAAAGNPANLVPANTLITQIDAVALFVGPALAGLLIAVDLTRVAFVLNAATYGVSVILLLRLRLPRTERDAPAGPQGWRKDIALGFRFLFRERGGTLGTVTIISATMTTFTGAFWTLSVVLSEQAWHFGAQGTGFLNAFYGLGGLAGAFLASAVIGKRRLPTMFILSVAASIVGIALFGLSPAGALPFVALMVFGLADVINQVAGNTIIQQSTPDELLGRVFGMFEAAIIGAILFGALVAGPLVDLAGPRVTTVGLAALSLACLLVALPWLRTLDVPGAGPAQQAAADQDPVRLPLPAGD